MTGEPIAVPEGAEESFVVREAVRRQNLIRIQQQAEEIRRLRALAESQGLDPDGPLDPFAGRSAA